MKKKLFAALAAALMLGGTMAAPVSAAETYKKGDVNMDGEITVADAQLAIMDYTMRVVSKQPVGELTQEQFELGLICPKAQAGSFNDDMKELIGAQIILMYATECLTNPSSKEMNIEEWADSVYVRVINKREG